jgi:hypothetical protein
VKVCRALSIVVPTPFIEWYEVGPKALAQWGNSASLTSSIALALHLKRDQKLAPDAGAPIALFCYHTLLKPNSGNIPTTTRLKTG